jgi:hypothetical protein
MALSMMSVAIRSPEESHYGACGLWARCQPSPISRPGRPQQKTGTWLRAAVARIDFEALALSQLPSSNSRRTVGIVGCQVSASSSKNRR